MNSSIKLSAPKRRKRTRFTGDPPFPVPIETHTGEAPSVDNWNYFTGVVIDDHVVVQHTGDMECLYRMGFFGKGGLSRNKPEYNREFWRPGRKNRHQAPRDNELVRVLSKRRYLEHQAWREASTCAPSNPLPHPSPPTSGGKKRRRRFAHGGHEPLPDPDPALEEGQGAPGGSGGGQTESGTHSKSEGEESRAGVGVGETEVGGRGDETRGSGGEGLHQETDWSAGLTRDNPSTEDDPWAQADSTDFWGASHVTEQWGEESKAGEQKEEEKMQKIEEEERKAGEKYVSQGDLSSRISQQVETSNACDKLTVVAPSSLEEKLKTLPIDPDLEEKVQGSSSSGYQSMEVASSRLSGDKNRDDKTQSKEQTLSSDTCAATSSEKHKSEIRLLKDSNSSSERMDTGVQDQESKDVKSEGKEGIIEEKEGKCEERDRKRERKDRKSEGKYEKSEGKSVEFMDKLHPLCMQEDPDGDVCIWDDSEASDEEEEKEKGKEGERKKEKFKWVKVRKHDPYPLHECLHLTFEEAFFLSYGLGCLVVLDDHREPLDLEQMWLLFSERRSNFVCHYVAYHSLRSRGWVPKTGLKYGADFIIYHKGPAFYHGTYSVLIRSASMNDLRDDLDPSNRKLTWSSVMGIDRVTEQVIKEVLVMYVVQPADMTQQELTSPLCISRFKIQEMLVKRWVPSRERQANQVEEWL